MRNHDRRNGRDHARAVEYRWDYNLAMKRPEIIPEENVEETSLEDEAALDTDEDTNN